MEEPSQTEPPPNPGGNDPDHTNDGSEKFTVPEDTDFGKESATFPEERDENRELIARMQLSALKTRKMFMMTLSVATDSDLDDVTRAIALQNSKLYSGIGDVLANAAFLRDVDALAFEHILIADIASVSRLLSCSLVVEHSSVRIYCENKSSEKTLTIHLGTIIGGGSVSIFQYEGNFVGTFNPTDERYFSGIGNSFYKPLTDAESLELFGKTPLSILDKIGKKTFHVIDSQMEGKDSTFNQKTMMRVADMRGIFKTDTTKASDIRNNMKIHYQSDTNDPKSMAGSDIVISSRIDPSFLPDKESLMTKSAFWAAIMDVKHYSILLPNNIEASHYDFNGYVFSYSQKKILASSTTEQARFNSEYLIFVASCITQCPKKEIDIIWEKGQPSEKALISLLCLTLPENESYRKVRTTGYLCMIWTKSSVLSGFSINKLESVLTNSLSLLTKVVKSFDTDQTSSGIMNAATYAWVPLSPNKIAEHCRDPTATTEKGFMINYKAFEKQKLRLNSAAAKVQIRRLHDAMVSDIKNNPGSYYSVLSNNSIWYCVKDQQSGEVEFPGSILPYFGVNAPDLIYARKNALGDYVANDYIIIEYTSTRNNVNQAIGRKREKYVTMVKEAMIPYSAEFPNMHSMMITLIIVVGVPSSIKWNTNSSLHSKVVVMKSMDNGEIFCSDNKPRIMELTEMSHKHLSDFDQSVSFEKDGRTDLEDGVDCPPMEVATKLIDSLKEMELNRTKDKYVPFSIDKLGAKKILENEKVKSAEKAGPQEPTEFIATEHFGLLAVPPKVESNKVYPDNHVFQTKPTLSSPDFYDKTGRLICRELAKNSLVINTVSNGAETEREIDEAIAEMDNGKTEGEKCHFGQNYLMPPSLQNCKPDEYFQRKKPFGFIDVPEDKNANNGATPIKPSDKAPRNPNFKKISKAGKNGKAFPPDGTVEDDSSSDSDSSASSGDSDDDLDGAPIDAKALVGKWADNTDSADPKSKKRNKKERKPKTKEQLEAEKIERSWKKAFSSTDDSVSHINVSHVLSSFSKAGVVDNPVLSQFEDAKDSSRGIVSLPVMYEDGSEDGATIKGYLKFEVDTCSNEKPSERHAAVVSALCQISEISKEQDFWRNPESIGDDIPDYTKHLVMPGLMHHKLLRTLSSWMMKKREDEKNYIKGNVDALNKIENKLAEEVASHLPKGTNPIPALLEQCFNNPEWEDDLRSEYRSIISDRADEKRKLIIKHTAPNVEKALEVDNLQQKFMTLQEKHPIPFLDYLNSSEIFRENTDTELFNIISPCISTARDSLQSNLGNTTSCMMRCFHYIAAASSKKSSNNYISVDSPYPGTVVIGLTAKQPEPERTRPFMIVQEIDARSVNHFKSNRHAYREKSFLIYTDSILDNNEIIKKAFFVSPVMTFPIERINMECPVLPNLVLVSAIFDSMSEGIPSLKVNESRQTVLHRAFNVMTGGRDMERIAGISKYASGAEGFSAIAQLIEKSASATNLTELAMAKRMYDSAKKTSSSAAKMYTITPQTKFIDETLYDLRNPGEMISKSMSMLMEIRSLLIDDGFNEIDFPNGSNVKHYSPKPGEKSFCLGIINGCEAVFIPNKKLVSNQRRQKYDSLLKDFRTLTESEMLSNRAYLGPWVHTLYCDEPVTPRASLYLSQLWFFMKTSLSNPSETRYKAFKTTLKYAKILDQCAEKSGQNSFHTYTDFTGYDEALSIEKCVKEWYSSVDQSKFEHFGFGSPEFMYYTTKYFLEKELDPTKSSIKSNFHNFMKLPLDTMIKDSSSAGLPGSDEYTRYSIVLSLIETLGGDCTIYDGYKFILELHDRITNTGIFNSKGEELNGTDGEKFVALLEQKISSKVGIRLDDREIVITRAREQFTFAISDKGIAERMAKNSQFEIISTKGRARARLQEMSNSIADADRPIRMFYVCDDRKFSTGAEVRDAIIPVMRAIADHVNDPLMTQCVEILIATLCTRKLMLTDGIMRKILQDAIRGESYGKDVPFEWDNNLEMVLAVFFRGWGEGVLNKIASTSNLMGARGMRELIGPKILGTFGKVNKISQMLEHPGATSAFKMSDYACIGLKHSDDGLLMMSCHYFIQVALFVELENTGARAAELRLGPLKSYLTRKAEFLFIFMLYVSRLIAGVEQKCETEFHQLWFKQLTMDQMTGHRPIDTNLLVNRLVEASMYGAPCEVIATCVGLTNMMRALRYGFHKSHYKKIPGLPIAMGGPLTWPLAPMPTLDSIMSGLNSSNKTSQILAAMLVNCMTDTEKTSLWQNKGPFRKKRKAVNVAKERVDDLLDRNPFLSSVRAKDMMMRVAQYDAEVDDESSKNVMIYLISATNKIFIPPFVFSRLMKIVGKSEDEIPRKMRLRVFIDVINSDLIRDKMHNEMSKYIEVAKDAVSRIGPSIAAAPKALKNPQIFNYFPVNTILKVSSAISDDTNSLEAMAAAMDAPSYEEWTNKGPTAQQLETAFKLSESLLGSPGAFITMIGLMRSLIAQQSKVKQAFMRRGEDAPSNWGEVCMAMCHRFKHSTLLFKTSSNLDETNFYRQGTINILPAMRFISMVGSLAVASSKQRPKEIIEIMKSEVTRGIMRVISDNPSITSEATLMSSQRNAYPGEGRDLAVSYCIAEAHCPSLPDIPSLRNFALRYTFDRLSKRIMMNNSKNEIVASMMDRARKQAFLIGGGSFLNAFLYTERDMFVVLQQMPDSGFTAMLVAQNRSSEWTKNVYSALKHHGILKENDPNSSSLAMFQSTIRAPVTRDSLLIQHPNGHSTPQSEFASVNYFEETYLKMLHIMMGIDYDDISYLSQNVTKYDFNGTINQSGTFGPGSSGTYSFVGARPNVSSSERTTAEIEENSAAGFELIYRVGNEEIHPIFPGQFEISKYAVSIGDLVFSSHDLNQSVLNPSTEVRGYCFSADPSVTSGDVRPYREVPSESPIIEFPDILVTKMNKRGQPERTMSASSSKAPSGSITIGIEKRSAKRFREVGVHSMWYGQYFSNCRDSSLQFLSCCATILCTVEPELSQQLIPMSNSLSVKDLLVNGPPGESVTKDEIIALCVNYVKKEAITESVNKGTMASRLEYLGLQRNYATLLAPYIPEDEDPAAKREEYFNWIRSLIIRSSSDVPDWAAGEYIATMQNRYLAIYDWAVSNNEMTSLEMASDMESYKAIDYLSNLKGYDDKDERRRKISVAGMNDWKLATTPTDVDNFISDSNFSMFAMPSDVSTLLDNYEAGKMDTERRIKLKNDADKGKMSGNDSSTSSDDKDINGEPKNSKMSSADFSSMQLKMMNSNRISSIVARGAPPSSRKGKESSGGFSRFSQGESAMYRINSDDDDDEDLANDSVAMHRKNNKYGSEGSEEGRRSKGAYREYLRRKNEGNGNGSGLSHPKKSTYKKAAMIKPSAGASSVSSSSGPINWGEVMRRAVAEINDDINGASNEGGQDSRQANEDQDDWSGFKAEDFEEKSEAYWDEIYRRAGDDNDDQEYEDPSDISKLSASATSAVSKMVKKAKASSYKHAKGYNSDEDVFD